MGARVCIVLAKNCELFYNKKMKCTLCPRNCNADRTCGAGFCGTKGVVVSRISKHMWEEPCISGNKGSGTVFFAGCNLKCRFCQNYDISVVPHGVELSPERLADVFLYLQEQGVANVNLVTAAHVVDEVAVALQIAKPFLKIPVVYNTSSYEKVSSLQKLEGLVDVYLPDLKFCDSSISKQLCGAENYFEVATAAIKEMRRQQPNDVFDGEGYVTNGVLVRYLALPSFTEDGKRILDWIASLDKETWVSVMSQYFSARHDDDFPQLNRRLFRHEYENLVEYFYNVGLKNGFMQDLDSATVDYLPDFIDGEVQKLLTKIPKIFGE